MLTILKDVEDEVHQSSRLRYRYPWFDNLEFDEERVSKRVRLNPSEKSKIVAMTSVLRAHVLEHASTYTKQGRSPPSQTDCFCLAFGQVRPAIVATDDLGMHLLADEFEIPIFHCHEVLKKMLTANMVDKQKKTHRNGWVNKPCNWPKGNINPSGCQAVKVGCGSQALKKTWQGSLQIC